MWWVNAMPQHYKVVMLEFQKQSRPSVEELDCENFSMRTGDCFSILCMNFFNVTC
jgi:hypothetical protein